jgi:hypothetical protein
MRQPQATALVKNLRLQAVTELSSNVAYEFRVAAVRPTLIV